MPRRTVNPLMIVKTDKGDMLVDKHGNKTPLIENNKQTNEKKNDKKI